MADQDDKDQKTEEASSRRIDEARDEGNVAMSTELIAATGLVIGLLTMTVFGGELMSTVGARIIDATTSLDTLGTIDFSVPFAAGILEETLVSGLEALAFVTLPPIVVSLMIGYMQVGYRVTPKALELKWSKLDPVQGTKRLFGMRAVVRTAMSAVKVLLIGAAVVTVAWSHAADLFRAGTNELRPMLGAVGKIVFQSAAAGITVILVLACIDFVYQRYQHGKDLRMTKQEVKEEAKLTDGDPHVRARIRQMQNQLANRRMMSDVPKATVVVTNPTHYAVALRYERDDDGARSAPTVIAKGVDRTAQRIKAIAAENDIICYEDVPLARALYAQTEVGDEIPEDLYAAVAAVLGYVYRMRGMVPSMSMGA